MSLLRVACSATRPRSASVPTVTSPASIESGAHRTIGAVFEQENEMTYDETHARPLDRNATVDPEATVDRDDVVVDDGDQVVARNGSGTAPENQEHGREALGAGGGALAGAAVGMAVAGPPGALVGGAIGATGGALAGEASEGDDEAGSGAGGLAGGLAGAAAGAVVAGPPGAVVGGAVGAAGGAGIGDQAEEEAEESAPKNVAEAPR
jgi:hypothetical protein